jgi:hypothetical protein
MARALKTDPINNVQCTVCLEVRTDPRTLPCCHSFCKVCLEGVVQHRGRPIHMVTLNRIGVEKSWK